MITFTVPGAPVGKGRARFVRAGTPYTPSQTRNFEALVAVAGKQAMAGRVPFVDPVVVHVTAFMPMAKSWTKKETRAAIEGTKRPGRPDADNLLKAVADALNKICWSDDALICEARISKLYDVEPRTEVVIEPLVNPSRGAISALQSTEVEA